MLLGLYSSLLFYVTLRKYSRTNYQHILVIIVLYPSLNIFTSYITKDLLIFSFYRIYYLLLILKRKKNFLLKFCLLAIGILLIDLMFLVLSLSVLIIFAFRYKYKKLNELYFLVTLILVALLIFLFLFNKIYTQVFLGNGTFSNSSFLT